MLERRTHVQTIQIDALCDHCCTPMTANRLQAQGPESGYMHICPACHFTLFLLDKYPRIVYEPYEPLVVHDSELLRDLLAAITTLQQVLGVNPHGDFPSVVARLDALSSQPLRDLEHEQALIHDILESIAMLKRILRVETDGTIASVVARLDALLPPFETRNVVDKHVDFHQQQPWLEEEKTIPIAPRLSRREAFEDQGPSGEEAV